MPCYSGYKKYSQTLSCSSSYHQLKSIKHHHYHHHLKTKAM